MRRNLLFLFACVTIFINVAAENLFINGQEYDVDTVVAKHSVGPGIEYACYRLPARPLDIFVLEHDLTSPYFHIEVWNGVNAGPLRETPSHAGERYAAAGFDVVAVHNGDYYTTQAGEAGISRMGLLGAGEVIFNPTGKPLLCIDNEGVPRIDTVNFDGTVAAAGRTVRLHTVNQLRLEWEPETDNDRLSLFTPAFGAATHTSSTGGTVAVLKAAADRNSFPANAPLRMTVVSTEPASGVVEIPVDGAVLHGLGESAAFLDSLLPGDTLTVFLGVTMPSYPEVRTFREAVGGSGHIILCNGELADIGNPALHPRTFMGISKDRKTMYSVIIDGRSEESAGIDLDDQGRVLLWLGAYDGINLDGGGSSCLVVEGVVRNRPSDGRERAVGNGVIFYSTAPESEAR